MKNKCLYILLICLLMAINISGIHAQNVPSDEISLIIPRNVITNMINAALPLNLENGPFLKGDVWIHTINNLKIDSDKVMFDMNIRGKNIKFGTQLGNKELFLDIGNINAFFNCNTSLRYDAPNRLLYITPVISQNPDENKADKNAATLVQLLSLTNGTEYPFEIQKFEPIITKTSKDQFNIDIDITNIYTEKDKIFIIGRPKLTKVKATSP